MAEKRIFFEELKNTSKECTIGDLTKDLLNSKPINDSEKEFQNCIVDLHKDENTYTDSAKLTMMYVQVKKIVHRGKEQNEHLVLQGRACCVW